MDEPRHQGDASGRRAGGGSSRPPGKRSHPHLSYRSRHRAASHDAAHDAAVALVPENLPDDPRIARGPAELITDDDALAEVIGHLRSAGSFAYDSEFIGEMSYHPQLCLVQVATTERVALIDPQAGIDLTPYWELLGDGSVLKIVHAGGQDVEPVHRHVGKPCANLFDTQIAAGFCAMAYPVALSKLVGEVLSYKMPKGLTFTDWQRRPLSPSQLRYAADDVRFLPALADELNRRLVSLGHGSWVARECEEMCDPARYAFDPESDFLNIRGAGTLTVAQLSVLRSLMIWRERCAREADCPPRAFVRDEALIDLARKPAKSLDRLDNVKFLPRPVVERHGREIVGATLEALNNPPPGLKRAAQHEPTPTERFRTESLWAAAQGLCLAQGMDPAVAASRQDVAEFDRAWVAGAESAVAACKIMRGWRREAVGDRLVQLLRGDAVLGIRWSNGRLVEPESPAC